MHEGAKEDLAPEQAPWPRAMLMSLLEGKGSQLHHGASNVAVVDGGVSFTTSYGLECTLPTACVVDCEPLVPNDALARELDGICDVIVVGDAETPSNIMNAVATGNLKGRQI